ncbi:MAG: hypothetical protein QG630_40 [Patescibacteria group bacterium]|nr:hypothetical protein [Patescibacteria group bacterium]
MKRLSQTLLSLTVLVVIIFSTNCGKTTTPPTTPPTTYTVSFNANGGSGSTAPQTVNSGTSINLPASSFTYTGYTFVNWNTASNGSGTSYSVGSSYTVTANATLYAIWQVAGPTAVFTAVDASLSATLKSLPGNSNAKALLVNVTTAGTAKLDVLGALTNGNPAIAYYWITSRDSSEVFQATSTLNPILAKTVASATQTINLSVGLNVICFKTALLSGAITNGATVGLKLTGASGTISNASYTADAISGNLAGTIKILLKVINGTTLSPGQIIGTTYTAFQLFPYSDQNATTYDGAMYPSILSISYDTKNTAWFTGTFTGYSNLDFTNAAGPAGQKLEFSQTTASGSLDSIFTNSNANLSSGILQFSKASGTTLVKANLGTFAFCVARAYTYNPASTVGPFSVCWYLKSIRFVGNPELWIYAPDGSRIW